jgi:hypothetical protein
LRQIADPRAGLDKAFAGVGLDEMPHPDRPAGLGDCTGVIGADLPACERRRPHGARSGHRRMRQQQRLRCDLDRLLDHGLGRVRDIADKAEPMARADHLGAEFGEAVMGDRPGLKVADIVGRVVDELQVPQTALMRFFQPLEFAFEKVQPSTSPMMAGSPALCAASMSAAHKARRTP